MIRSALAAVMLLAGTTLSVAAGPAQEHGYAFTETVTEELHYEVPAGVGVTVTDDVRTFGYVSACASSDFGCVQFPVRDDFRMYEVEIIDEFGETVLATSTVRGLPDVCGASDGLLHLHEGVDEVSFFVTAGTCEDGTTSLPTSGTVRVTFHASNDDWCRDCRS